MRVRRRERLLFDGQQLEVIAGAQAADPELFEALLAFVGNDRSRAEALSCRKLRWLLRAWDSSRTLFFALLDRSDRITRQKMHSLFLAWEHDRALFWHVLDSEMSGRTMLRMLARWHMRGWWE